MKTHKILFVCLGNICRSPMAEYVLRHSKIKPSDAEHFDYIIVMDDNNLRETEKQLGFHPGKIFKLTDLIPDSGYNHVPDPWYTGDFDETYRLVDAGSLALLEKLKQA